MNSPIDGFVSGLRDFPLDPNSGNAWLWSADGSRLLWASSSARQTFGLNGLEIDIPLIAPERFHGLAADLRSAQPDQQPVRAQQLTLRNGAVARGFTCLSRPVRLVDGGYGLLAVAVGAASRPVEAQAAETSPESQRSRRAFRVDAVDSDTAFAAPVDDMALPSQPVSETVTRRASRDLPIADHGVAGNASIASNEVWSQTLPAPHSGVGISWINSWVDEVRDRRRPLRFVWQTDVQGRFVHLSRELADAVGPSHAMIMGQTIQQAAARIGITETAAIAESLSRHDTWSANAALWPVQGSSLAVPVELSGMPVVENGVFAGFRGYGIARIERAIAMPGNVVDALAEDRPAETDSGHSHFGPAIERALADTVSTEQPQITAPKSATINPLPILNAPEQPKPALAQDIPRHVTAEIPVAKPSLSTSEREAFREIARALEKADRPEKTTGDNPERVVNDNAQSPQAPLAELPEAPKPGSLQALKKDLAKRSKLRLGATSVDEPELPVSMPKAPVVSYDALQARREQRGRSEATQAPWASMMDSLPVGLLVTQNGQAVYANRYLLDITGYPDFDSFQSQMGASGLFTSTDSPRVSGQIDRGASSSYSIMTRKGEPLKAEATLQSTSWNEAPATLTSIRPVTEVVTQQVKALELDLISARSELRELQSVLDTATDGIVSIDTDGRILGMNRSAEALFGFDQNELIGEPLTVLLEPESHVAALDYLEGLKSNGVRSIMNDGRDVKGRERNGGILPLFMTIGAIGGNHRLSRFCVVLRDITHWKKVETDLLEAKRLAEDSSSNKTDFLTMISHEIRTPLNAILGFSQVMMTESFGPIGNERYRQYAQDINTSGEHVISLVNDLLNLSKVASGKLEMTFGSVDVNAVVASCVAMIQPQANAGKVIVRSQLSSHLPQIVADERAIRQIVINLLSNAAKFTDAGGQVIASTTLTDQGEVIIRVRDTGIGMDENDIKRALEPFRQVHGPRSGGGTGLGLPLTKALVEANRAAFSITSGPKEGTLVEVTFPSTRVLAE